MIPTAESQNSCRLRNSVLHRSRLAARRNAVHRLSGNNVNTALNQPVMVIFENLQWTDAEIQALPAG